MTPPRSTVFLARATYRRRRMRDAAKMLPIFGAVLFLLPLLRGRAGDPASNGAILIYIFGVWGLLTLVSAVLSALLRPEIDGTAEEAPGG